MRIKLIHFLLFIITSTLIFYISITVYNNTTTTTTEIILTKMKSWKDMAIDLMKEEQQREEYRNSSDTKSQNINSSLFLKLKRQYHRYYRFKIKDNHQYLLNYFIQTEFDKETMDFIMETPRWNFVSNTLNWAMSWVYTKTDIMGYIGKGNMMCLSTEQYKQILKVNNEEDFTADYYDGFYYESLLDIGAGCGTTTLHMKPLFKNVIATEASKGMVYSLNKKGIDSIFCLDLEQSDELKGKKFDVVSCLNVLDRCEKPISLLNTLKKFLKPNGKIILAVVFPFKPYVEFGGIDNLPIENIKLDQDSLSQYVDSFNRVVFSPNGFIIDSFTVGPYISEGDANYQNYVLTDVIFVLKVAPTTTTTTESNKEINNLMSCD